jgi:hypothetical protein
LSTPSSYVHLHSNPYENWRTFWQAYNFVACHMMIGYSWYDKFLWWARKKFLVCLWLQIFLSIWQASIGAKNKPYLRRAPLDCWGGLKKTRRAFWNAQLEQIALHVVLWQQIRVLIEVGITRAWVEPNRDCWTHSSVWCALSWVEQQKEEQRRCQQTLERRANSTVKKALQNRSGDQMTSFWFY